MVFGMAIESTEETRMPRKLLLVTEIDEAEHRLTRAVRADYHRRRKPLEDKAKKIMDAEEARIVRAINRLPGVRVEAEKAIRDCIEFFVPGQKRSSRNYRDAICVDATRGQGELAGLWRLIDKHVECEREAVNEIAAAARRLRSDLRLADRCREGDDLHRRVVAFVEWARAAKG